MALEHSPPASPAGPRQRNPRGDGVRLREQLVLATIDVLDEVGDEQRVSVRAIARRAGVSPTALYLHFPDRDSLVEAAVDRGFDAFNAALAEAGTGHPAPRARLQAIGEAYLAFAAGQPAQYAVLFSARRPQRPRPAGSPVQREASLEALVALLRDCVPGLPEDDARHLAFAFWAALHGYATLCAARPMVHRPPPAAFARLLGERLLPSPT